MGRYKSNQETSMARYLDTRSPGGKPPPPDIATQIRTNPRIKAVLWSIVAAMLSLVVALVVTGVL
jgi:hypothetical protein